MYCSHDTERFQLDNLLSFMSHELVFLGYHLHLGSYSYSCKILQPNVAATVRMQLPYVVIRGCAIIWVLFGGVPGFLGTFTGFSPGFLSITFCEI